MGRLATNLELNQHREADCTAVLQDRKYFTAGNSCIKRTLRKREWISDWVFPSAAFPQRWTNDGTILRYLAAHTDIPLPRFQCVFEDDGAFYHCTERVPGVSMDELSDEDKKVVTKELMRHLATLKSLRSDTPGIPAVGGAAAAAAAAADGADGAAGAAGDDGTAGRPSPPLIYPPQRVISFDWGYHSCWRPRDGVRGDFVFCHNDLGRHNIIVDPETLKINAIIDWEFGGFWPDWFERPFWERPGPSAPLEGEQDDRERCREWLVTHCDEVVMPQLLTMEEKLGFRPATPPALQQFDPADYLGGSQTRPPLVVYRSSRTRGGR